MAAPATRIVSLTVTEGGYNLDDITGEFDATNPAVVGGPRAGAVAADDVRPDHRGAGAAPRARDRPVHGHVLRQPAGQRPPGPQRRSPPSPGCATRSWATGSSARCASPTRWSTGSRRSPPTTTGASCASASASTTAGRSSASRSPSGCSRTPSPTGRPPYEDAGRAGRRRRRALRADEAAAAQRQPPGAGLLRATCAGYRLVHEAAQDPLFRAFLLGYMDEEATPDAARRCPGSICASTSTR